MRDTQTALPERRRDEFSDWHDLVADACPTCTCTYYYAKDDAEILWEPGKAWSENCTERSCRCHVDPIIGSRRD